MCGRFQLSVRGKEISERFNVEVFDDLYTPKFNCAPSQILPVISNSQPGLLSFFRWGLEPGWMKNPKTRKLVINARSETILQRPSFKNAFIKKRCLVPANGFYEWRESDKTPFRIFLKDELIFALAGIWEASRNVDGEVVNSFAIITTMADSKMAGIHSRMPVILSRENEKKWLMNSTPDLLQKLLLNNNRIIEMYPISKKVNSVANDGPKIIDSVNIGEQTTLF